MKTGAWIGYTDQPIAEFRHHIRDFRRLVGGGIPAAILDLESRGLIKYWVFNKFRLVMYRIEEVL